MNYPPPGGPPPGNYGPPHGNPGQWGPPPQPPAWPQQQWAQGQPPRKRGSGWKWALGAVALSAVIGVTAAVTISVTSDKRDDNPKPSGETYGLASADDTGPVNIITEDPSCAAWMPIQSTLAKSQGDKWGDRDSTKPATSWTPEERAQYDLAAKAYRDAAERTVPLVKVTPNRVVRELYEQFIAYSRAYSDALPTYTEADNHLVGVATSSSGAIGYICGAITYGSAQASLPFVSAPPAPAKFSPITDPNYPEKFQTAPNPTCEEWDQLLHSFSSDTKEWQALDARVPATDWTPQQRAVVDAVMPVMRAYADKIERLGLKSGDPVMSDFATLSAQYRRAYAEALPTYTAADSYLARAANRTSSVIFEACEAVSE